MNPDNCLFCGIVAGEINADKVSDDDEVIAIRDINPQAPVHLLVIPRRHIPSAADLTPADDALWATMLHVSQSLAREHGIDDSGYRLVVNIGRGGGQTVGHLHMHVLGGRQMSWPPG
jgi:histidine triad (HIT) family protein